ncbi:uncharacterized protein BJ212DRAFT_1484641 [Suillus subaureus]|uniref:DUF6533 domain-containing protein n=1 Tax=Suillus subaureus TaxID=48587 RepID=A0A9P7E2A1_9AGAM|nr:uncharacterized protein BJ212DRAFT_1484641 [Suillus subaureus]KAG1809137.1 hypothetical protein BJ212DRAFT_1484641 [Suillus subaureus]
MIHHDIFAGIASPVSGLDGLPAHLKKVNGRVYETQLFPLKRIQMEYSTDDVTATRTLQLLAYLYTSMATFWTYDYICSLHEEWTFLLRSRWTKVKALYITARYVPFLITTMNLYLILAPNENTNNCQIPINLITSLSLISLTCSECLFVLRTYTLWNKNRILLVAMLFTLFAITVPSFIIGFTATATSSSTASAIPSCDRSSGSFSFLIPFILLLVFQLVLISLTLVRVMQRWRSAKGPLYAILVKHNIFYYACGLLLSVANVVMPVLPLSDSISYFLPKGFEVFILAILATRMHLHLWNMGQHVRDSDIAVCISMSDMSPADCTV